MLVKELLIQKAVFTAEKSTSIRQAMQCMLDKRISCLPVIGERKELVGIISDKDIFRLIYENGDEVGESLVGDCMTTNLIVGLASDEVDYIATIMTNNRIRHIPIVDGKTLIGLVSVGDVVKSQIEGFVAENRYLRQYIDGSYPG